MEKWSMVISVERGRRAFNRIKVRKRAATQKLGRDENLSLRIRLTSHLGWESTRGKGRPGVKRKKSDDLSDTDGIFFFPLLFSLSAQSVENLLSRHSPNDLLQKNEFLFPFHRSTDKTRKSVANPFKNHNSSFLRNDKW